MNNIIFSRAHLYSDGSGIQTGVSFDPTLRLIGDHQYVRINEAYVRVDHIDDVIAWLVEVQRLAR